MDAPGLGVSTVIGAFPWHTRIRGLGLRQQREDDGEDQERKGLDRLQKSLRSRYGDISNIQILSKRRTLLLD